MSNIWARLVQIHQHMCQDYICQVKCEGVLTWRRRNGLHIAPARHWWWTHPDWPTHINEVIVIIPSWWSGKYVDGFFGNPSCLTPSVHKVIKPTRLMSSFRTSQGNPLCYICLPTYIPITLGAGEQDKMASHTGHLETHSILVTIAHLCDPHWFPASLVKGWLN